MRLFLLAATFCGLCLGPGFGLQIQCYQCEEFQLNNDCSAPEFIVNCTVNVQDMCQKEVMEKSFGDNYLAVHSSYYRIRISAPNITVLSQNIITVYGESVLRSTYQLQSERRNKEIPLCIGIK
ncbi:ly6/PLAUR domain-containing protein 1 [Struthio camelus]|uniref:ly6/PLAUR domain-containing protein 1 n=1 Tax=Struthio camelus TaxID=8801 RepID=UPI003603CB75